MNTSGGFFFPGWPGAFKEGCASAVFFSKNPFGRAKSGPTGRVLSRCGRLTHGLATEVAAGDGQPFFVDKFLGGSKRRISNTYVHVYVYCFDIYVCIVICIYIHMYLSHLYLYMCIYIYICIFLFCLIYICFYICMFVFYIYLYLHIYIYIYLHIYIYYLYISICNKLGLYPQQQRGFQI